MSTDGDQRATEAVIQPRWGLGDAAAGFAVGFVLSIILTSIWLGATGDDELSLAGQALSQLGLWTGLAGCVVLACRRKGTGRLRVDFGWTAHWTDLPIGVTVGLLGHVLVLVVAFLLRPLLGQPDVSGPAEELFEKASGLASVVLVLFVVVGAPMVEELFFRGLVLRSLHKRLPMAGWTVPVLVSGVLFGLAHPQPLGAKALALAMISLAALGALFAALVVRTGRLGTAIIAHAVFNGWTAVSLLTG